MKDLKRTLLPLSSNCTMGSEKIDYERKDLNWQSPSNICDIGLSFLFIQGGRLQKWGSDAVRQWGI
jgi:hypothetical protein